MHFKSLRAISVFTSAISLSTRQRSEIIKSCVCIPEDVGCIPLAVAMMTTANGMHPTFSGRHTQLFFFLIFTDLYRLLTEFAEVH